MVWEGRSREAPPYPDYGGRLSAYDQLAVVNGMAVQNVGLWVQSPELELRDLPGDTPNRLRKARAKELSES